MVVLQEDRMYPRTVIVTGDLEVELWPMTPEDAPALLEFYSALPAEDLLYLRADVTSPEAMDRWVEGIESGQAWHLLAACGGRIVADGELDYPPYGWSRHVGELRLVVARELRGSGLSMVMARDLLAQSVDEGLYKVIVQMTVDQQSAIQLFTKLGFRREALLSEHVQDQHGELRDLVIMAYFTRDFLVEPHLGDFADIQEML
jgi:RimJ/RimL family protein N-acetyltransferase